MDTVSFDAGSVEQFARAAGGAAAELQAAGPGQRAEMLQAVAESIDANRSSLVRLADEETGLGAARLDGEVDRTIGQLHMFADVVVEGSWLEVVIDHADPQANPPRPDLRRMLVAVGPVAVFAASNFPFAFSVAGGDTASAWAAGCPVVVKAHPGHPRLSRRTADIVRAALQTAGAPDGAFAMVEGVNAGRDLVRHPTIRAAAFTGSLRAGRALFDLACTRPDPIPFFGELSSINPVIIGRHRDAAAGDEIARGLLGSAFLSRGQFCTKPGVVFVPRGSKVLRAVVDLVDQPSGPLLTPAIAASFDAGLEALIDIPGIRVVSTGPGGQHPGERVPHRPPTVLAADVQVVLEQPDVVLSECFGPVTLLVEYDGSPDLVAAAAVLPGALTGTVHADEADIPELESVLACLRDRVGRLIFDGWPTGVAVTWSMQHGGPWPSTTNAMFTSVGATALRRFLRPLTFQNAPPAILPAALLDTNPWRVPRRIDRAYHAAP